MYLLISTVKRKNARWYISKKFLPKIFDYRRELPMNMLSDLENGNSDAICAICMMTVDTTSSSNTLDGSSSSSGKKKQRGTRNYMLTPCNHLYHDKCLTQWFESGSMTCPVCRSSCPPERNSERD